jgi:hypothetical protein
VHDVLHHLLAQDEGACILHVLRLAGEGVLETLAWLEDDGFGRFRIA